MTVDVVVSRELNSLQDELSAVRAERLTASAVPPPTPANSTEQVKETADERELRDQLRDLTREVTNLFEEAERSIATHPTQSVLGALLIGILIGRLIGRR